MAVGRMADFVGTRKMNTTTRDKALELLQSRSVKLTLKRISDETGLNEGWLSMFSRGKIKDPSHSRLQTLYEYLITRCHG